VTFFTPFPAKSATFSTKLHSHFFTIQHPRVSASRERGKKLNIQNPSVAPLTPSSLNPLRPLRPLRAKARPGNAGREPSAFTLVELLAVVGIMGLLAAVAVPALKGLTGSGGRKQALNQLMGALEIARNTAISTGTNAAVIFPDSTFASGEAYKYRSMAVVAWNATNSATPATMVGSWIVLPQGVAFFPNSLKTANLPTATNISVRILTTPITASFPGVVFQSDGALDEGLFPVTQPLPSITFFEGTVDGTAPNRTSKTTIFETVGLTRYTGRAIPTVVTNAP
jgi:prepilin-type N-terminal cleavage/methylation domain-containing protein